MEHTTKKLQYLAKQKRFYNSLHLTPCQIIADYSREHNAN